MRITRFLYLQMSVRHILVTCPHLQPVRDDVFGNESGMESFRFHAQLIINFFLGKLVFTGNSLSILKSFIVDFTCRIPLVI